MNKPGYREALRISAEFIARQLATNARTVCVSLLADLYDVNEGQVHVDLTRAEKKLAQVEAQERGRTREVGH